MKEQKILERNTTILKTPLVDVEIVDEAGGTIAFDIVESRNTRHTVNIDGNAVAVEHYAEKVIRIPTESLVIGKTYYVKTSKPIEYRDSDEHLFTYGYTEGTQTFAISFPDPNDEKKMLPEEFGTDMEHYDFHEDAPVGTRAVSFQLIDRAYDSIEIPAAWIWDITDHMNHYEFAVEVFTW